MTRLFAVDTMAVLYRSHFAMIRAPLINSRGVNVSGLRGLVWTLMTIWERERPDYFTLAADGPDPTFRHQRYPDYKATREKMPEELVGQLPYLPRLAQALGLRYLLIPGFEADDIIGTLARQAQGRGWETFMVTGDKDYMQLVDDRTFLYAVKGDQATVTGTDGVREKWGVDPNQVVDLLALMGDSSDNVPGVRGVGEKTAAKLIGQFGGLEALYQRLGEVKGKLAETLAAEKDNAWLSRELVTLHTDVPMGVTLDDLVLPALPPQHNDLFLEMLTELEFQQFRDKLLKKRAEERPTVSTSKKSQGKSSAAGDSHGHQQTLAWDEPEQAHPMGHADEDGGLDSPGQGSGQPAQFPWEVLDTLEAVAGKMSLWRNAPMLAVDTETTGLDILSDRIVGVSLAAPPQGEDSPAAWYIPFNAPGLAGRRSALVELLRPLLEGEKPPKCGHNMKYDLHMLAHEGIRLGGLAHDTMIASHLIEPAERRHDLDSVALRRLGVAKIPTESLIGKGADQITMAQVEIPRVARYACEDAWAVWRLQSLFTPQLNQTGQAGFFASLEMALVPVLARMENAGIRFDAEGAKKLSADLSLRLEDIREDIYREAGERDFNIASIVDLQRVLYEKLKLHETLGVRPKKIKTGMGFSTDEETLEKLSAHPLPRRLLDFRRLVKLQNTYLDALPGFVNPITGRIHTHFRQTVAATGRLASDNPNLQNIPVRSEEGARVRALFLPSGPGWKLLSADYSQIELRVAAHYSQDPTFLQAFQDGLDIHALTAQAIFQVSPEQVNKTMRAVAKEVNFGLIYRMGAERLALVTATTKEEAKAFIERFFTRYSAVRDMQESLMERARKEGFAQTLLGRRRYLPDIHDSKSLAGRVAEGMAVNTPIQGTAAEIIKAAMIRVHRRLAQENLAARMVLTIHDELLFDVPEEELEQVKTLAREEMESAMELSVPLKVDLGTGDNWLDAKG
ncbi:MAG: DNA polymerase I [Deltaproteobacteria bacterium]|nr:DNA polymerase I [Deltaproteobacteria bacterium]